QSAGLHHDVLSQGVDVPQVLFEGRPRVDRRAPRGLVDAVDGAHCSAYGLVCGEPQACPLLRADQLAMPRGIVFRRLDEELVAGLIEQRPPRFELGLCPGELELRVPLTARLATLRERFARQVPL